MVSIRVSPLTMDVFLASFLRVGQGVVMCPLAMIRPLGLKMLVIPRTFVGFALCARLVATILGAAVLRQISQALPGTNAGSTLTAAILRQPEIVTSQGMSALALVFEVILRGFTQTTKDIELMRDRLQMSQVDTGPDTTGMVWLKAFWNWAIDIFVQPSVGLNRLMTLVSSTANGKPSIAVTTSSLPNPAGLRDQDLCHESVNIRHRFFSRHIVSFRYWLNSSIE
jgi:hypothetical protein